MKKLIIISTFLISMFSFSLPVGELNIKGGFYVGYLLNKDDETNTNNKEEKDSINLNNFSHGGFVDFEYLYTVFQKDNLKINTGAGLTFTGYNYHNDLNKPIIQLDVYGKPQIKYSIDDNISIYTGLKAGIGYKASVKTNEHYLNVPIGLSLGLNYESVNVDLTLGNDFSFRKVNNTTTTSEESKTTNKMETTYNLNGRLSVGYSF